MKKHDEISVFENLKHKKFSKINLSKEELEKFTTQELIKILKCKIFFQLSLIKSLTYILHYRKLVMNKFFQFGEYIKLGKFLMNVLLSNINRYFDKAIELSSYYH